MGSGLEYGRDSKFRAAELSSGQKHELQQLIMRLELPDYEEPKPMVPAFSPMVLFKGLFGPIGSVMEGGLASSLTPVALNLTPVALEPNPCSPEPNPLYA